MHVYTYLEMSSHARSVVFGRKRTYAYRGIAMQLTLHARNYMYLCHFSYNVAYEIILT